MNSWRGRWRKGLPAGIVELMQVHTTQWVMIRHVYIIYTHYHRVGSSREGLRKEEQWIICENAPGRQTRDRSGREVDKTYRLTDRLTDSIESRLLVARRRRKGFGLRTCAMVGDGHSAPSLHLLLQRSPGRERKESNNIGMKKKMND